MRELEGLSYDSIGNRMGLTRGAVESLLFRARRRLRDGFDEIDTGERCQSMRTAMERVADGSVAGARAPPPVQPPPHCKPCRRHAIALGLDSLVLGLEQSRARRAAPPRRGLPAAAGLPAPPPGRGGRRARPATQAGVEQGATLAGKAAVVLVAAVVAAGGAGVAHKASGGDLPLGGNLPVVGDSGGSGGRRRLGQLGGAGGRLGRRRWRRTRRRCRRRARAAPGGTAGGAGPGGPNGPGGRRQRRHPGGLGGHADALRRWAAPADGEAGRLGQTLTGPLTAWSRSTAAESVGRRRGRVAEEDRRAA